jgi:hypothetical protein
MHIHLKIIGILLITLALVHVIFPKYFKWREDLKSMSLINQQMMYVHTFFIGLTLILMGIFCFLFNKEIVSTELGKIISFGFGIFWFVRLFFQFFIYSKKHWYAKRFETSIHILFVSLWSYFTIIFFTIFFEATVF